MGKKIIVQLQGSASLGAFQAGAWQELAPFVRREGHQLVAVAGASIGALNAAMIARHCRAYDGGQSELLALWRRELATAPLPFFMLPGEYWRAWNGLLTGLLMGNRGIYAPPYMNWNPFGDMARSIAPVYDNRNAEVTTERHVGQYSGTAPRLIVGASDIKSGELALFDSARQSITGRHIRASMAIPNLQPPIVIDGRYYWDGDLRSNSLLDDLLPLLRAEANHDDDDEWLVIAVTMFSGKAEQLPVSALQGAYRWHNMLLGSRVQREARHAELSNRYLEALERIRQHAGADDDADGSLARLIEEEYEAALQACGPRVEVIHVNRENFPFEHVSREFDFSPAYIERLIE